MNLRELKEIFRLVEKTDFTEVEIVHGDSRVRIERGKGGSSGVHVASAPLLHAEPTAGMGRVNLPREAAPALAQAPTALVEETAQGEFVKSPFVGTFYRAPSPDVDPYVEVGSVVRKGQSLCIIEAMKLMNEIESDYDGKIAEIYAQNGQPVEFGAKLFRIVPA